MMLKINLFLLVCIPLHAAFGQDSLLTGQIKSRQLLLETGSVFLLNSPDPSIRNIKSSGNWKILDSLTKPASQNYAWLKTIIHNDLATACFVDFNFPSADSITAFVENTDTSFVMYAGPYIAINNWPVLENPGVLPIYCHPGESLTLYFRLWSAKGRPFSVHNVDVRSREHSLNESLNNYREFIGRIEFNGFFLGAATFTMLFSFFIFARGGERAFLFYGFYLLGASAYAIIVKTLPYSYLARLAYIDYPVTYMLGEPVQYLFFAAFMAFGKALLDIDKNYKWLNKCIKVFTLLLCMAGVIFLINNIFYFDYQLQRKAFILSRLIILPIAVSLLIWIAIKVQNPVKWFFIAGSSFFLAGGLLAIIVDPKTRHLFFGTFDASPIVFFKTGILLESLCFALALGYKIRLVRNEMDRTTKAYIQQLELNRKMAVTENDRLEKMVLERSAEIIEKNREIEDQKELQIRSDFQHQLSEMEMKALRSQMNPHFVFNSLNSIRYQIMKTDYDSAVTYITRFSKLLRYILQNSREHVINFAEEVEMNKLYVQLESLRFSQGIEFHIDLDEKADISEIMIPPMLLQPFVENAVKHGLVPSQKELKKLAIRLQTCSSGYMITIEDNGMGRQFKRAQTILHDQQQLGMKISAERIALFNGNYPATIELKIEDVYEGQNPAGTRVIFFYKNKP